MLQWRALLWRCPLVLLRILGITRFADSQSSAVPYDCPDNPSPAERCNPRGIMPLTNNTYCCQLLALEARQSCLEFEPFGVTPTSCIWWEQVASDWCISTGGDCAAVAHNLNQDACWYQLLTALGRVTNGFDIIRSLCGAMEYDFRHFRCPSVCYAGHEDCYAWSDQSIYDCKYQCGNYRGCTCRQRRDLPDNPLLPDYCFGDVVVNRPISNAPGAPNHTCASLAGGTLDFPPDSLTFPDACRYHVNSSCAMQRLCPSDLCVINQVVCETDNQCEEFTTCEASSGLCYFRNKEYGTPCDDGIFWTTNDICNNGFCRGTPNYCIRYSIECIPMSSCVHSGVCQNDTGFCIYERYPDGTRCDDLLHYTLEDRCQNGFCIGDIVDLCVERGIVCPASDACQTQSHCDPLTGICRDPIPLSDIPCDDNDPSTANDTCVEGICVGGVGTMGFISLGLGECADRNGRQMARYSGDVVDEADCKMTCENDKQCAGYVYSYPTCAVYGTVRTVPPSHLDWFSTPASDPPGIVIEAVKPGYAGARAGNCRVRSYDKVPVTEEDQATVDRDLIFQPFSLFGIVLALLACFCIYPLAISCKRCFCGAPDEPVTFSDMSTGSEDAKLGTSDALRLAAVQDDPAQKSTLARMPESPSQTGAAVAASPTSQY